MLKYQLEKEKEVDWVV